MKNINKVLNENYENKNWFGKNYFWAGTLAVVIACCIIFWVDEMIDGYYAPLPPAQWDNGLDFRRLILGFVNNLSHVNLQHVLLNMLCFFIIGLYLERKIGTIKLVFLVLSFAFLAEGIICAMTSSGSGVGYSGVNYAFYLYIIVDFAAMLISKNKKAKSSIVFGIIIVSLIYLAMCFNGGTSKFGFAWYPYDLFNNMGHSGGAIAGIIVGLIVNIMPLGIRKEIKQA